MGNENRQFVCLHNNQMIKNGLNKENGSSESVFVDMHTRKMFLTVEKKPSNQNRIRAETHAILKISLDNLCFQITVSGLL